MTHHSFEKPKLKSSNILIAEDSKVNQGILKDIVLTLGHNPILVGDGQSALDRIKEELPDLLLLDMMMPRMNGREVLYQLNLDGMLDKIPVIIISSIDNIENIASCIRLGAQDYMVKPYNKTLLQARIEACLERKHSREREEQYYRLIEDFNVLLEERVQQQVHEITQSHLSTIFAMSKLAESRDEDTGEHLERMREYCKVLCLELRHKSKYKFMITDSYIEDMYIAAPLHDLGKISTPDAILQKPGKLDPEEWGIMMQHTIVGAKTLREIHTKHPCNEFLNLGIEIAISHHEKWNGKGYPLGIKQEEIPLSGRIVALADVYDALTSKRCYKDAFSHEESMQIILSENGTHFDPDIVGAFQKNEKEFYRINCEFRTYY